MKTITRLTPLLLVLCAGCDDVEDDDGHGDHEHEVITSVTLEFAPVGGGDTLTFSWQDPAEIDDAMADDIVLPTGDYTLGVQFWNELENPAEDLTPEIEDEGDQHQLFFTGSGVEGPATGANTGAVITHAYADTDANGNPVGLANDIVSVQAGSGDLIVSLRHMPPEDGNDVKTSTAAEDVASGGFSAIGGANDVEVTFSIEVQ